MSTASVPAGAPAPRNATVAVIGAGDYIGAAIARRFAAEGYIVFVGRRQGEKLEPLEDPPAENLLILFPGVSVSTAEAYRSLNLGLTLETEDTRIHRFCGQMKQGRTYLAGIFNDFEASILPAFPPIREAGDFLRRHGATAVQLCGSGSAVFGFFPGEESALAASRSATDRNWRVFPAKTLSRTEYFQNMFG